MSRRTIVVIDEDTALLEALCSLLAFEEYECVPHSTVDGAAALVRAVQPDLVVLDTWIGGRGAGEAVLADLHADQATATIPVLVCTADTLYLETHASALQARGIGVLAKPFDIADLLDAVQRLATPGTHEDASTNDEEPGGNDVKEVRGPELP